MDAKERIAAAARREFGRYGYAGARVARIARDADVNKQLLFYYFGSKAGLYWEVAQAALADATEQAPASDGSPIARLREAVRHLHETLDTSPAVMAVLSDPGTPPPKGPVNAKQAALQLADSVQAAVSQGQGLGYFRDDVDPSLAAQQALALCAGHVALGIPTPKARWQESVTDLLLRALAW